MVSFFLFKYKIYVTELLKTWSTKSYAIPLQLTSPNEGFYDPDQPENHREEREEGKGAREKD